MEINGHFEGVDPFVDVFFGQSCQPVKVLVDTGFSGELMLQKERIDSLGLPQIGEDTYTTASGAEVETTIHIGSLKWFGGTKRVPVLATEGKTSLQGMALLFRHSLCMRPSDGILRIE